MSDTSSDRTVVIDLGKKKRKQVRRLQKGGGALLDRVQEAIAELRSQGQLSAQSETVVVVVEKKPRKMLRLM